eukprot:gene59705-81699_t
MATWYPLITRLRNIAEHALVGADEPDPLRHARTTLAGPVERLLMAPYYVNYHCEHHMFMHVPCWNLPKVHRLLKAKGVMDRMLTAPGYLTVLREASGKAAFPYAIFEDLRSPEDGIIVTKNDAEVARITCNGGGAIEIQRRKLVPNGEIFDVVYP